MKKYPLIGVSIIAVIVLILASLSNVVGFQTVQSSNQKIIKDEINQKDLLFQTIVDIANNKEIQRIILKSQINKADFLNPDVKFSVLTSQVLTKNQLKHMYFVGLILSKIISKSKIHSIVEQYQVNNQEMQKEIIAVIEKDATLNSEIAQLSNTKCDCEKENTIRWSFPILCLLLLPLYLFSVINNIVFLREIMTTIGLTLNCSWA
ncbi:MAG TPA: hypothetical protein DSN98_08465 [Thermoplasmata archaeon]|jgi:hypothetical protein|nr:MAG TPA: hypothetical protein DSN98_08465 [Thermoplasmata archaeon]